MYLCCSCKEPKATKTAPKFKEGSDLSVSRIWHIEPGPSNAPDTIYAGVEPAALFRSDDRGDTWHDVESLNVTIRRGRTGNRAMAASASTPCSSIRGIRGTS